MRIWGIKVGVVEKNEGVLTSTESLSVKTGKYTGRSPQDRYIIYDDETHETIDWGDVNRQFPTEKFNSVFEKKYTSNLMKSHLERKKDNRKLLWTLFVLENWLKNNQFSMK